VGQTTQKVVPGDPLRIPARTYNEFVDAANAHKLSVKSGALPLGSLRNLGTLAVRNTTEAEVERFGALAIGGLAIAYEDNPTQFEADPVVDGVAGTLEHAGHMVTLLEPVSPGGVARGVVSGVVPALVRMVSEQHRFADVDPANPGRLRSWFRGASQMLWVQPIEDRADPAVAVVLTRVGAASLTAVRAMLTASAEISANRWAYSWIEAERVGTQWLPVLGGVTSGDWGEAFNGVENNNSGAGVEGTGVNVDNFPGTFGLRPLQPGVSLEIHGPVINADGSPSWHFDAANSEDGECEP